MAKIDIIIPAYNTEKYISKCINSVLSQNFTDYRIIIVDDKSEDRTLDIANIYQREFSTLIKVISLAENKGAAFARNVGLTASKSEYVMFLDSDDELLPGTLEEINNIINKHDPDIINFNLTINYNGLNITRLSLKKDIKSLDKMISPHAEKTIIHEIRPTATAKCFKKNIITHKFPNGLKWEDYAFVVPYLVQTENIYLSSMIGYKYNANIFGTSIGDILRVPTKILDIFTGTDIINSHIDEEHHQEFKDELRTVRTINCLQRVRDLAFARNISKEDKKQLANLLVNLITIREGDYKELEWYHNQIKNSVLYRFRMHTIERELDKDLQTYTNEEDIKRLVLKITENKN